MGKILCLFGRHRWERSEEWPKTHLHRLATVVFGPCVRCGKGKAVCVMRWVGQLEDGKER